MINIIHKGSFWVPFLSAHFFSSPYHLPVTLIIIEMSGLHIFYPQLTLFYPFPMIHFLSQKYL
ncbi:hypothetical protein DA718_08860 [Klebsiella huaxiensis]|nr:hypothetical protein DA718_08860 [Klebsiella huaxiensis]